MSFILRILFTGLIAFVPNQDNSEVTVVLLNVPQNHHTSDGAPIAQHTPLLLARAGSCSGDCPTDDETIAQYLFSDQTTQTAVASLESAVSGGGAWLLSGSEISLEKGDSGDPDLPDLTLRDDVRGTVNGQPAIIPTTSTERGDVSWMANLQEVCPSGCTLDEDILGTTPPSIVAARFTLHSGELYTRAIARMGTDVTPVHFDRLDGGGSESSYSQAIASWIGADIEVSADSIEIDDASGSGRSMLLEPDENGLVEVAVLNLPSFVPPASSTNAAAQVGKHFEAYYELSENPVAPENRLVPRAGAASTAPSYDEVTWQSVHPQQEVWSDLLNALRLDVGRAAYDRVLCPPVWDPEP